MIFIYIILNESAAISQEKHYLFKGKNSRQFTLFR
jgi:hypothetical protein